MGASGSRHFDSITLAPPVYRSPFVQRPRPAVRLRLLMVVRLSTHIVGFVTAIPLTRPRGPTRNSRMALLRRKWQVGPPGPRPRDQKLVHEANCPDSPSGCAAFTSSVKPGGSLANSNTFQVQGGVAYRAGLSLRAPAGIKVKVLVRRGSPPYDPISAVQWITGNGAWQKISIAFIPRSDVTNARLDIENPPEGVKFHFSSASLTPAFATPLGAWTGDLPLLPAHHPNRGHDRPARTLFMPELRETVMPSHRVMAV